MQTKNEVTNIIDTLRKRILGGAYETRFPSERALMRQFGITRAVVRSALSTLEAQHIIARRRGSGTFLVEHARERASGMFGIIIPNAKSAFYAAMIKGITEAAKRQHDEYSLLISDLGAGVVVPRAAERLAEVCLAEHASGVFFRPLSTLAGKKSTNKILAKFRAMDIPVVLIEDDASKIPDGTGCDIVATKGYGKPDPQIAKLLGDIAFRLMLQRLAYPSHPPAEVLLDQPYRAS